MTYNPNIPSNNTSTEANEIERYKKWILMDINGCLKYNQDPRLVLQGNHIKFRYTSTAFNTNSKVEYLKTALQNAFDCEACTQILVTELATGQVTSITKKTENLENLVLAYQRPHEYSVTAFLSPQNPISREIIEPLKDEFLSVSDNFSFPNQLELLMRLGPDQKKYHLNNALLMAAFLELDEDSGYTLRCYKNSNKKLVSVKCGENESSKDILLKNFCLKPDAYTIVDVIKDQPIAEPKDPKLHLVDGSTITLTGLRAKIQDTNTPRNRLYRNGEVNTWMEICVGEQNKRQVARENAYGIIEFSEYNPDVIEKNIVHILKKLESLSYDINLGKIDDDNHSGNNIQKALTQDPNSQYWKFITSLEEGIYQQSILKLAINRWLRDAKLWQNFEIQATTNDDNPQWKDADTASGSELFYESIVDPENYACLARPRETAYFFPKYSNFVIDNIKNRLIKENQFKNFQSASSKERLITLTVGKDLDVLGPYCPSDKMLLYIANNHKPNNTNNFTCKAFTLTTKPVNGQLFWNQLLVTYNETDFIPPSKVASPQNVPNQAQAVQVPVPVSNQSRQKTINAFVSYKSQTVVPVNVQANLAQPQNITPQPKQPTQITTTIIPNLRSPNSLTNIIIGSADDGCFGVAQYQNGHHNAKVKAAIDALGWAATGYQNSNGLRNENYEAGQEWLANLLINERFKNSNDPRYNDIYSQFVANYTKIEPLAKHGAFLFGEVVYDPTHQIYISVLYNFTEGIDNVGRAIYFRRANWIVSKTKHDAQENLKLLTAHQQHEPTPQASPLNPQAQSGQNIYVGNKTMQLVNSNSLIQQNTPLDIAVKALDSGASGFIFGAKSNNTVQGIINYLNNNPIPDHRLNLQTQAPVNTPVNVAPNSTPNIPSKPQNTLNIAGQTPTGKMIFSKSTGLQAYTDVNALNQWKSKGFTGISANTLNMDPNVSYFGIEEFYPWSVYNQYSTSDGDNALPFRIKSKNANRIVTGQVYKTDISEKIMIAANIIIPYIDDGGRQSNYVRDFYIETNESDVAVDCMSLFVHIDKNYPDAPSPFVSPNRPNIGQETINIAKLQLQQGQTQIKPIKPGIYGGDISLLEMVTESIKLGYLSFIHGISPESVDLEPSKIRTLAQSPFATLLSFRDSQSSNDTATQVAKTHQSPTDRKQYNDNSNFSLMKNLKKEEYEEALYDVFIKQKGNILQGDNVKVLLECAGLIHYPEISKKLKDDIIQRADYDINEFILKKRGGCNKCLKMSMYAELFLAEGDLDKYEEGLINFIKNNNPVNDREKDNIKNLLDTLVKSYYTSTSDFRPLSDPKYNLKPKINKLIDLFTAWNLGVSKIP